MFAGRSLGKAYRPSHFAADLEPEQAENPSERQSRIRAYAQRAKMRLPIFDAHAVEARGHAAGVIQGA